MSALADWLVVAGFLLAVLGVALRIFIMMRSNDARPTNLTPLAGSNLVRAYRVANRGSWLPAIMWAAVCTGFVLLIAGFLLEFR